VLGKELSQEDLYATFKVSNVSGGMDYSDVSKDAVMEVLDRIENFEEIRMICLTPLESSSPSNRNSKGGFVGLRRAQKAKKNKRAS
jgi:hypothetical protein